MRIEVSVAGGEAYPVVVEAGALARVREEVEAAAPAATSAFLVTDVNVDRLHGEALRDRLPGIPCEVLPAGETTKSLDVVGRLLDRFSAEGLDRGGVVVSFGGGVVSDVAGFAAAIHLRGVRHVLVPTTLLAMVDAAIGGKTGVDTARGKNLVGAFWPPRLVLSDPSLLATLPRAAWIDGLAEVVKTALVAAPDVFETLETTTVDALRSDRATLTAVVERCARAKAEICSRDERDAGVRQLLNLGHTIGHALEAAKGYDALSHGRAVAVGLVAEATLAEHLHLAPPGLADRIARLLARLELPVRVPDVDGARVRSFLRHDKKRAGARWTFALPRAVGRVERVVVDDEAAIDAAIRTATLGPAASKGPVETE